ncbi:glyoxylate reductase [Elasticomyces elasticus]|nr:glyoxylate reductase [Elasticomyces elasticus]
MASSKPKVLLLGKIDFAHDDWKSLSDTAEIVQPQSKNRKDFIEECKTNHLNNVVAAYRTFTSIDITGMWDEELVNALPKSLKFCAHMGAGYDQIDISACSARDPPLRISNVPTAVDDATADTAVFLILGALRGFNVSMLALRDGKWRGQPMPPLGHDPEGKVLGVLGMGGIGRNMKKKCEAFGMTTIYHNRKPLSDELAGGAKYVSFDELLAQSDVLSLNLPLNKNTRHIISTAEFGKMKKGVIIVNTARGAVMDEDALVTALKSGQVLSVGLDVFENEPKVHPGLIDNPHVMLLPHMGTYTIETMIAMEQWCIANVRMAIETGKLKSPVPEQAELQSKSATAAGELVSLGIIA